MLGCAGVLLAAVSRRYVEAAGDDLLAEAQAGADVAGATFQDAVVNVATMGHWSTLALAIAAILTLPLVFSDCRPGRAWLLAVGLGWAFEGHFFRLLGAPSAWRGVVGAPMETCDDCVKP